MAPLFFFLLILANSLYPASIASHHPHHHHHRGNDSALRPPPPPLQEQLSDGISTLLATTDFQEWASLLLSSAPPIPNLTATIFIPSDDAISHLPTYFDPLLLPYHILPNRRLPFDLLARLPTLTHLATLLPGRFLLVTNTSVENFTINDVFVVKPDLFVSKSFAVHGITNILFYSLYREVNGSRGNGVVSPPERPRWAPPASEEVDVGSVWDSSHADVTDEITIMFVLVLFTIVFVLNTGRFLFRDCPVNEFTIVPFLVFFVILLAICLEIDIRFVRGHVVDGCVRFWI